MQMGNAVHNACEKLKQELFSLASQVKGGKPEDWRLIEGRLCCGEISFSIREIIGALGGNAVVKCAGYHSVPPTAKASACHSMDHWALSAPALALQANSE